MRTITLSLSKMKKLLPPRKAKAHKYSFGRLQILAGSATYPGAAALCALGAFKAGCGFVTLKTFAKRADLIKALPEIVFAWDLAKSTAFVTGPGLGARGQTQFRHALKTKKPLVCDATALSFLRPGAYPQLVITPHLGEAQELLRTKSTSRMAILEGLQRKFPTATIVLKGKDTLIANSFCREIFVCKSGSVAMASAGQGDVLSGVIGAFLAAGVGPLEAAKLGVFCCALAADRLAKKSRRGVLAHEVANALPQVIS
jgi:hydroxyethylthiazole kinase-like uncharacterized protein yjeF